MAAVVTEEMGSPITFSNLAQSPAPWMMLNTFIQVAKIRPMLRRLARGACLTVSPQPSSY